MSYTTIGNNASSSDFVSGQNVAQADAPAKHAMAAYALLEADYNVAIRRIEELTSANAAANSRYTDAWEDARKAVTTLKDLMDKMENMNKSAHTDSDYTNIMNALAAADKKNIELSVDLQANANTLYETQRWFTTAQNKIVALEASIEDLKNKLAEERRANETTVANLSAEHDMAMMSIVSENADLQKDNDTLKKANESLQGSWNEMNKMYSTANTRRVDAENENGSICKQLDDLNDAHADLKTQHAAQKENIVNLQKVNRIVNVKLDEATADAQVLGRLVFEKDHQLKTLTTDYEARIAQLQKDLANAQNANSGMMHGLQSLLSGSSK